MAWSSVVMRVGLMLGSPALSPVIGGCDLGSLAAGVLKGVPSKAQYDPRGVLRSHLARPGLRMVSAASTPPAAQNTAAIHAATPKPWASAAGCR